MVYSAFVTLLKVLRLEFGLSLVHVSGHGPSHACTMADYAVTILYGVRHDTCLIVTKTYHDNKCPCQICGAIVLLLCTSVGCCAYCHVE